MATYLELFTEFGENTLNAKVTAAILIACEAISQEDSVTNGHSERVAWAQSVVDNPEAHARRFWGIMIAANKDLSIVAIQGATDTAIQNNVNNAVNLIAGVAT